MNDTAPAGSPPGDALVTRCPACGTVFRTYAQTLLAHQGMVRCSQCQTIFDARANRTVEPPLAAAPGSAAAANVAAARAGSQAPAPGVRREPGFVDERSAAVPVGVAAAAAATVAPTAAPTAAATTMTAAAMPGYSEPSWSNPDATPGMHADPRVAPRRRSGIWRALAILITLLLLLLLVAQLAFWQRETVMMWWPQSAPYLSRGCAQLGCGTQPPRNIDGLAIAGSSLQRIDQRTFDLRMMLRNQTEVPIAYPSLEISLSDASNHLIVRRVLSPAEYLPPPAPPGIAVLANGAQQQITLRLTIDNADPSNYRVLIFYP